MTLSLYHLVAYTFIAGIAYLLFWQVRLNRIAKNAAKRYCQEHKLQFLDQNIVLKCVSLSRVKGGLFLLERCYCFEFASIGDHRYHGYVTLLGRYMQSVELEPYKINPLD